MRIGEFTILRIGRHCTPAKELPKKRVTFSVVVDTHFFKEWAVPSEVACGVQLHLTLSCVPCHSTDSMSP